VSEPAPAIELESRPRGPLPAGWRGWVARWDAVPLYVRILIAMALGVLTGVVLGPRAGALNMPARLIIRLLGALAPPLILLAVIQALMHARIRGRQAARLGFLLLLNTTVAIVIGLAVANTLRPGRHAAAREPPAEPRQEDGPLKQFLDQVPDSLVKPLVDNNVIGVIFVAVAFGVALRTRTHKPVATVGDLVDVAFECVVTVLHWVIAVVPIAVFGVVAATVGTHGFAPFVALGAFVVAVVTGLLLQATWYLVRIRFGSWVRPLRLLKGSRDALAMAFSTDSSSATMPVTYACLRDKVGLRDESARMGALVGSNFNNDGTALYEAMSALFIAQLVGRDLSLGQQLTVVVMSIIASVGAAGIPEAGTVTMLLVLRAVHLPDVYIPMLLTVDWFLDRCRTTVNVMGDMNVSCLLDGKTPPGAGEEAADAGRHPVSTEPSDVSLSPEARALVKSPANGGLSEWISP